MLQKIFSKKFFTLVLFFCCLIIGNFNNPIYADQKALNKHCTDANKTPYRDCNPDFDVTNSGYYRSFIEVSGTNIFNSKYTVSFQDCVDRSFWYPDTCYKYSRTSTKTFSYDDISRENSKECNGKKKNLRTEDNTIVDACVYYDYDTSRCDDKGGGGCVCAQGYSRGWNTIGKDTDFMGCVPIMPVPGPPIYNEVVLGAATPTVVNPRGVSGLEPLSAYYNQYSSKFENPVIVLDVPQNGITPASKQRLVYDFTKATGINNQNCFTFAEYTYCPKMNAQGSQICAEMYKDNVSTGNLGCIPRPGITENSDYLMVAQYQRKFDQNQQPYQTAIPLFIKGAKVNQPIGNDIDNSAICIRDKRASYEIRKCDIPGNDPKSIPVCTLLTDGPNDKKCRLNQGIIISQPSITQPNSKAKLQKIEGEIREQNLIQDAFAEYYAIKDSNPPGSDNKIMNYKIDTNYLNLGIESGENYDLGFKAIITQAATMPININKTTSISNLCENQPCGNCDLYERSQVTTGIYGIVPGNKRITNACYCSEKDNCPMQKLDQTKSVCSRPLCTSGKEEAVDRAVCPGIYKGSSTGLPDSICLYSNNFTNDYSGWDPISGANNQLGDTTNPLSPQNVCAPLPQQCNKNSKFPVSAPYIDEASLPNTGSVNQTVSGVRCKAGYIPASNVIKYDFPNTIPTTRPNDMTDEEWKKNLAAFDQAKGMSDVLKKMTTTGYITKEALEAILASAISPEAANFLKTLFRATLDLKCIGDIYVPEDTLDPVCVPIDKTNDKFIP